MPSKHAGSSAPAFPNRSSGTRRDGPTSGPAAIPRSIWALGIVSLFMDLSSETIHSLLPVFMASALGASALTIGLVEGIAEATASITKVFSGALSDWIGRRKLLVVFGYGLAAVSKPLFPLAGTIGWVFAARFMDRIGKGIRGAPRDALIADIAPPDLRGASFGLRQSLDTVGAFAGPLLAVGLMVLTHDNFRLVFWIATLPAFLAVFVLLVGVEEPRSVAGDDAVRKPLRLSDLQDLDERYWWLVGVAAVFTLARFSEAFLVLRALGIGLDTAFVPLVLVVMNVVYTAAAYPVGALSDRIDRRNLLVIGFAVLALAELVLAAASGVGLLMVGVMLWGLHMGMTQGLLSALVADTAPAALRGTAFGMFNLAGGIALLLASGVAGWLWSAFGAATTFLAGAGFTVLGIVCVMMLRLAQRG